MNPKDMPNDTMFKKFSKLIPLSSIDWERFEKFAEDEERAIQPTRVMRFVIAVIRLQKQHLDRFTALDKAKDAVIDAAKEHVKYCGWIKVPPLSVCETRTKMKEALAALEGMKEKK